MVASRTPSRPWDTNGGYRDVYEPPESAPSDAMVWIASDQWPKPGSRNDGSAASQHFQSSYGNEEEPNRPIAGPRNYNRGWNYRADQDPDTIILDVGFYNRQAAGIAALLALANNATKLSKSQNEFIRLPQATKLQQRAEESDRQTLSNSLWVRLRQDHMMRNSLYLMLNSGLQAGFGFAFWIIAARLFSAADVGTASSLISATTVIAYLALLGLNNAFGRYLPTASDRNALITSGLTLVAVCGAVIALAYILLTPFIAPRLAFVEASPELTAGFALITATAAVNILTDSVFVASRKASYTAFVDGIIGGVGKVLTAVALVGAGAYGIFCASTMGAVLAAIASLALIFTAMHCRPSLKRALKTLKPLLRFSGANYLGNVLNMLPTLAVPIIVLDRLGAASAAYYFVAFQVASILYAAALSVEQTFLAEGSYANANMRKLKRRSLRILVMLCLPAALCLIATGHWLLLAFGWRYYHYGAPSLVLLAAAAGPIAANYWLLTILRLAGRLRAIVIANGTYAVSICGLAWLGASHGLTAVAAAWPTGALLAACVAGVAVPHDSSARHRRPVRVAAVVANACTVTKGAATGSHRIQHTAKSKRKSNP